MHRNAGWLSSEGFFYSEVLGRPNNIDIAVYGMDVDADDQFFLHRAISDASDHNEFRLRIERELANEVAAARNAGCHTFIISNEHCHSRLLRSDQVQSLYSLLTPLFERVEIFCYIRPQVDLAVSLGSTLARQQRITSEYFELIRATDAYFDYHALLGRWAGIFGRDTINVAAFKSVDNAAADFVRRIGFTSWQSVANDRHNASLDVHTIAILNAVEAKPRILAGRVTRHPMPFVDSLPVVEKIKLPLRLARAIQSQFAETNRMLVAEWPLISIDDLEPKWSNYDERGNLEKLILPSPLDQYLKPLVNGFNQRNWVDDALLNLAYSQRAEARGNLPNAQAFFIKATDLAALVRQTFGSSDALNKAEKAIEKHGEVLARKLNAGNKADS
jgi:hypothetical protein